MHSLLVLHHVTYRPGGLAADLDFCSFCYFLFVCFLSNLLSLCSLGCEMVVGPSPRHDLCTINHSKGGKNKVTWERVPTLLPSSQSSSPLWQGPFVLHEFPRILWVGMFCVGHPLYRRSPVRLVEVDMHQVRITPVPAPTCVLSSPNLRQDR